MEEPPTQSSVGLKCSLADHISSTAGNRQLQQPASSEPGSSAMEHRAEVNVFAIFLLCSLVPLGSLAPTATSGESKTTRGQSQNHHITEIKTLAAEMERQATILFKKYNACSPVTPQTLGWLNTSWQAREVLKAVPECPAFQAGCCALRAFHYLLQSLGGDAESLCGENFTPYVARNVKQLHSTLGERAALHGCRDWGLPPAERRRLLGMNLVEKKMLLWLLLQKYQQVMQNAIQRDWEGRGYTRVTQNPQI